MSDDREKLKAEFREERAALEKEVLEKLQAFEKKFGVYMYNSISDRSPQTMDMVAQRKVSPLIMFRFDFGVE